MTPEERKAYDKAYYKAHKEKITARSIAYRKANKDALRAYHCKYKEANRESVYKAYSDYYHKVVNNSCYIKSHKFKHSKTHEHAGIGERTKVYRVWDRASYGNRKMKMVYEPWDFSHNPDAFLTFLADVGDETEHGKKLCRIDTTDGFHPHNVEWR